MSDLLTDKLDFEYRARSVELEDVAINAPEALAWHAAVLESRLNARVVEDARLREQQWRPIGEFEPCPDFEADLWLGDEKHRGLRVTDCIWLDDDYDVGWYATDDGRLEPLRRIINLPPTHFRPLSQPPKETT